MLRDPPLSKLHLISCRNLLIYLDRELQQQLQNVFRYGLRDDGRMRREPWGKNLLLVALSGWGHEEHRRAVRASLTS